MFQVKQITHLRRLSIHDKLKPPLYKAEFEFSKFSKKGGVQIFPIKREGLVK